MLRSVLVVMAASLAMVACDSSDSAQDPITIAGKAVEGTTPSAEFLATCLRTYQGIQLVETGASVRRMVESLRLAPSAVMRWERVSASTYILRLTNDDPLTRQSGEISMQIDLAPEATATPDCGAGVTDVSRMTVNGSEISPQQHLPALMSLIDFERLADDHLAGQSQNASGAGAQPEVTSQTSAVNTSISSALSIREPIENFWNDWTFQKTSAWEGDPIELTVAVEGKTRSYDGVMELVCSQNGRVIYTLHDASGEPVDPLEIPEAISHRVSDHYC